MSPSLRLAAVFLVTALAGCATTGPSGPAVPTAEAEARQLAREQTLRADTRWGLEGRIAVSSGRQGGSGRIEWAQDGEAYDVVLSAPITRQGWRLSGRPGAVRLEGIEGGPRSGTDASALLYEATRWDIPVDSLRFWLRGLRAPGAPASMTFGRDGRLARLQQGGWAIDYTWPADAAADLPLRLDARRDTARVRLAVDHWVDDPPAR